jgi:transcriptional regulator with XRE-family HTH domain
MISKRDVAAALKTLRAGRSQAAMARAAGIDPTVWNLYEKGQRLPREKSYPKIANGLGCTVYQLAATMVKACLDRLAAAETKKTEPRRPRSAGAPRRQPVPADEEYDTEPVDDDITGSPADDPYQHEIRRHLRAVLRHVEALLLLGRK